MKMVLTAKPASRRVTTLVLPPDRAREYTSAMVAAEPAKASMAVALKPRIDHWERKVIPRDAPKVAPPDDPMTYGSAMGLRKSPWNSRPERAKAVPTRPDARTRGRRR